MTAGFQVFDAGGQIMIDSEYFRFGLVKSGIASRGAVRPLGTQPTVYRAWEFTVTGAVAPVVYVRSPDGQEYVQRFVIRDGSTWTFLFNDPDNGARNNNDRPPHVYVFDYFKAVGTSGIQLFNADGEISFNSNQPPLNVAYTWPICNPGQLNHAFYGICVAAYTPEADTVVTWDQSLTWTRAQHTTGLPSARQYAIYCPYTRGGDIIEDYQARGFEYYGFDETNRRIIVLMSEDVAAPGWNYTGGAWPMGFFIGKFHPPGWPTGDFSPSLSGAYVSVIDVTDLPFPYEV